MFGVIKYQQKKYNYKIVGLQKSFKNIDICFEGKIYNQNNLKFEYLYNLYYQFKTNMFRKIDGTFNIAIYDKVKEKLYIARDKVGEKPLYLYQSSNNFAFSDKLKDFYNLPTFTKKINKAGLVSFLEYGYVLESDSIFENVSKVKSGHFVEYDLKYKKFTQKQYWCIDEYYQKDKFNFPEKKIINSVEKILHKSITKRLNNNKKIAVSLSGGFDSSTIATILSQQSKTPIDTFTIGFYEQKLDEAPYSKALANYLGTNHYEIYFSDNDALNIIPKLYKFYDEPFADHGAVATILLSKIITENKHQAYFAGDGADKIFGTYRSKSRLNSFFALSIYIRKILYILLSIVNIKAIPFVANYKNIAYKYEKMLLVLKSENIPEMIKIRNLQFLQSEIEILLQQKIFYTNTFDEIKLYSNMEYIDKILSTDFKTFVKGIELTKSSGSIRSFGVEAIKPYLDEELIEYMIRVPQSIKIKNNIPKYVLKQIIYKYVPQKLMNRPKSGFAIPIERWMKGVLKELIYEQLSYSRLKNDEIFDTKSILEIRDKFYRGEHQIGYKLWYLFIFQLWYQDIN